MKIREITNLEEIKQLNVVRCRSYIYEPCNMGAYSHVLIVGNIVVNISCNAKEVNDNIIECIKNDNYDFCGIIGMLKE